MADTRLLGRYSSEVNPHWDVACLRVLEDLVDVWLPTVNSVIARIDRELAGEQGAVVVPLPDQSTAQVPLKELARRATC